jgi:IrrE N-terminal-like domain
MMPTDNLKSLFKRLSDAHLEKGYVRDVLLPSWWDDRIASTDAGVYEAMAHIAARLGVSIGELRGPTPPNLASVPGVRYKLMKGTSQTDVTIATRLALQVARAVVAGAHQPIVPIPTAAALRARLLNPTRIGVGFVTLLDWCWSAGIVVLHVSRFPRSARKPQAFAAMVDGRFVIILCGQWQRPAWLLFHLAHELGHLALGHVKDGEVLVDDEIDTDSVEQQETAANAYALHLLTGDPGEKVTSGMWPRTLTLAAAAIVYGKYHNIDPGHVILNFARNMSSDEQKNFHVIASDALDIVEGGANAIDILRSRATEELAWDDIADSARDFVDQMISGA